ncbi:hypothetical protein ES703_48397 [subsurface metagenome]
MHHVVARVKFIDRVRGNPFEVAWEAAPVPDPEQLVLGENTITCSSIHPPTGEMSVNQLEALKMMGEIGLPVLRIKHEAKLKPLAFELSELLEVS